MKVCVFTPTRRYGGLDVNQASLEAQGIEDLVWIVGDELEDKRRYTRGPKSPHLLTFKTTPNGQPSSLCRTYNLGVLAARSMACDLLISMQDYLWAPPDGIQRFIDLAATYPTSLLTGACSLSNDPYPSEIKDPTGGFTIFAEPYDGHKPTDIGWEDVRINEGIRRYVHNGPYENIDVEWWEANWAAIPRKILYDERLSFNETYDRAVGHENQDYALQATALGYGRVMDPANHAIGLPHRAYFPEETALLEPLRKSNMLFHTERLRQANLLPS